MILGVITTCPQRWKSYQLVRSHLEVLVPQVEIRTFNADEALDNPRINNNLNGRAAIRYGLTRLPEGIGHWLLYLEDDLRFGDEITLALPQLTSLGTEQDVDCWYLCNRKNPAGPSFKAGSFVCRALHGSIQGSHALLIPQRHLQNLLKVPWTGLADEAIFSVLNREGARIWQVLDPILVEHIGEYSTYDPKTRRTLEVNYAT